MSQDQVQEVKDRVNIADFVGNYVELKMMGATLKGLCPFHQEKTPSFVVNEERQVFKCFGCGEGGDVFTFLEKIEGFNFREALEYLAERAGVELKKFNQNKDWGNLKDKKTRVYKLNQAAARFFNFLLTDHPSGKKALDYIQNRGLTDKTIKEFQVGYAPAGYQLKPWAFKQGFNDVDLTNAGRPERFRDRVIFPLKDALGNIVGFTGRSLDDDNHPKYLNSPETEVFKKNKNIYGLSEGKDDIRHLKSIVLVEGQMDVITSHQAGFRNVVASSGTALTLEHLQILRRYSEDLILVFDNDEAGAKATLKAIELSQGLDFNLKTVSMPQDFKDADEIIKKNPEIWQKMISEAKPAIENIILKEVRKVEKMDANQKKSIAKKFLPIIGLVQNSIEKSHYLSFLGSILGVPEEALKDALEKTRINRPSQFDKKIDNNPHKPKEIILDSGDELICIVALSPDLFSKLNLDKSFFEENDLSKILAAKLFDYFSDKEKTPESTDLILFLKEGLERESDLQFDLLLAETIKRHKGSNLEQIALEIKDKIKSDLREKSNLDLALKVKFLEEQGGDQQAIKDLLKEHLKSLHLK